MRCTVELDKEFYFHYLDLIFSVFGFVFGLVCFLLARYLCAQTTIIISKANLWHPD